MRYFKIIIGLICYIAFIPYCNAENWEYICSKQDKSVYLDIDSVIKKGDSIFFNVEYWDEKTKGSVIATIQYKNGQAGVSKSYTWVTYSKNKNIVSTKNANEATNFKYISGDSLLYPIVMQVQKILKEQEKEKEYQEKLANEKVDWEPYMKNLEKKLKKNWKPPKTADRSNRTVLFFVLEKDNNRTVMLSNNTPIKIVQSSGFEDYDQAAIEAVENTRFDDFPQEAYDKSMEIQFTFDYNLVEGK